MNIFQKTISDIKRKIPRQLLEAAFLPKGYYFVPVTIESGIINEVIRGRVLFDCDIVGGQMIQVPLQVLTPDYRDNFVAVYSIPKELTAGRSIMSALSVGYVPGMYQSLMSSSGSLTSSPNSLALSASRVMASHDTIPTISSATVNLVGENMIQIRDTNSVSPYYYLRCMVANDPDLSNIQPRSYLAFSKLVTEAVKSHIYTKLVIDVDRAYLDGGRELNTFKEILDRYEESENEYYRILTEEWAKVALMNDTPTWERYIKMQINPGI